jgi:hypothetical protein
VRQRRGGGSGLVAWPVFKTATEKPSAAPVGSIPTRSRHVVRFATVLLLGVAPQIGAQQPSKPAPVDTTQYAIRGIKPVPAFLMSLAVPGWGQARLDRKLTAGLFVMWEGVSLGMTMKTIRELKYLTRANSDSNRVREKRKQRQDWFFLLGFNHLFSGLEALVASELHAFATCNSR